MGITMEEKKREALRRIRLLGIAPEVYSRLDESGVVSICPPGESEPLCASAETAGRIKEFEEEKNALVYLVVRNYLKTRTRFLPVSHWHPIDNYLFVSDDDDLWELDRLTIRDGHPFVYTYDVDTPEMSEYRFIWLAKNSAGGLNLI